MMEIVLYTSCVGSATGGAIEAVATMTANCVRLAAPTVVNILETLFLIV
jgi:hypothetical protein